MKLASILLFTAWVIITFMLLISIISGFVIPIIDDKKCPQLCWWDVGENILKNKK